MKQFLITTVISISAVSLSACTQPKDAEEVAIGMANPASEYCVKLGGKTEIKKDEDGGEFGMCHFPDGTSLEEWELFRRDHKDQK
jgi:putative hemolysin